MSASINKANKVRLTKFRQLAKNSALSTPSIAGGAVCKSAWAALLASTVLATTLGIGVLMAPQPALAACSFGGGVLTCTGSSTGVSVNPGSDLYVYFGNGVTGREIDATGSPGTRALEVDTSYNYTLDGSLGGSSPSNSLSAINADALRIYGEDGDITINTIGGPISSTGWGEGVQVSTENGDQYITLGTLDTIDAGDIGIKLTSDGHGDISLTTLGADITSGGDGIKIWTSAGSIDINNASDIESGDRGINAVTGGSLAQHLSIINSGDITSDGRSIYAKTYGGANISIENSGNLETYYGRYGIYARSEHVTGTGGEVVIDNLGIVQVDAPWADAAIYGRASGGGTDYVLVENGDSGLADANVNPNARVNAYYYDGATGYYDWWDANGVELRKNWDGGSLALTVHNPLDNTDTSFNFGAVLTNYGTWDFTRLDDYLTPGYADGSPVAAQAGSTSGGIFAPGGKAVELKYYGSDNSAIFNSGTIIGQGNRWDPVLYVRTYFDENFVGIYNSSTGVIGSAALPFAWPTGFSNALMSGADTFLPYVASDDTHFLAQFHDAANDHLLEAGGHEGAPVYMWNEGLLVGRLKLRSYWDAGGNAFLNDGAWFTRGESEFHGGPYDLLYNRGLIQTGFDPNRKERTEFEALNYFYNAGVLSMIDGGARDRTKTSGDYFGGIYNGGGSDLGVDYLTPNTMGYLAVDVKFGQPWQTGVSWEDQKDVLGKSDRFTIYGTAYGQTGLIVNPVNAQPGGINHRGILVVRADSDGGVECTGLCKNGNTFFIDPSSRNYFEVNGVGLIQDGFFAWGLMENEGPEWRLASDWAPQAYLLPGVITGMQHIFYDTDSVVDDHIYGGFFAPRNVGGGGADLPIKAPPPVVQHPSSGWSVWANAKGSWGDYSTSATTNIAGISLTFDTGFKQDTYSFLGGAEHHSVAAGGDLRLGVFGGYVSSDEKFKSWSTSAKYSGGTVGGYVAFIKNQFYVDARVKADLLRMAYKAPLGGGFSEADVDATNVGVLANAGRRYMMGSYFLEPILSFAYVNTSINGFSGGGATVDFSNGNSLRLGGGARVGTQFASAGKGSLTEVSVLGKVWNEFEANNTVTLTDNVSGDTASFNDHIQGVFGEVLATATTFSSDRSLSGFAQGGAKFNNDFTDWTAKVGVRKNF